MAIFEKNSGKIILIIGIIFIIIGIVLIVLSKKPPTKKYDTKISLGIGIAILVIGVLISIGEGFLIRSFSSKLSY